MIRLDQIEAAYRRFLRDVHRRQEDTLDPINQDAFEAAETDERLLEGGMFLLVWGRLEARINEHCAFRLNRQYDGKRPPSEIAGMVREMGFDRRLRMAVADRALRTKIGKWYDLRSDIAHGRSDQSSVEVAAIITGTRELDASLADPSQRRCPSRLRNAPARVSRLSQTVEHRPDRLGDAAHDRAGRLGDGPDRAAGSIEHVAGHLADVDP